MFFVGTVRQQGTGARVYRARLRLEDGGHRVSRRSFRQAEQAVQWGRGWVRRARRAGRDALRSGG